MAVQSILPKTNLKKGDVRDTLADGGGAVDDKMSSLFKSAAKINWQSKYKPVGLNVNKCQDFDSSADSYYKDWWKGSDGFCGINIPTTSEMITSQSSDGTWSYKPPTGGTNQPYRLGDFRNYATSAKTSPYYWGDLQVPSVIYADGIKNATASIKLYSNNSAPNDLKLGDIFDSLYFAFRAEGKTNTVKKNVSVSVVDKAQTITLTSSEINQLGTTPGGYVYIHLYGVKNSTSYSLRATNAITTLWSARVMSDSAFTPEIAVDSITCAVSGEFVVNGLDAILNASYHAGGSLAKDSGVLIYPYYGENWSDYENKMQLRSWMLPAMSVSTLQTYTYEVADGVMIDATVNPNFASITKVMIWWISISGEVLAKKAVDIKFI